MKDIVIADLLALKARGSGKAGQLSIHSFTQA
jgi:hypothetical protein